MTDNNNSNLPWPVDPQGKPASMSQFLNQGPNWLERLLPIAGFSLPIFMNRIYYRRPWHASKFPHLT